MTQPRFDPSFLIESADPWLEHDTSVEEPDDPELIYRGRRVSWVGTPGVMLRVDADMVIAMAGNSWNPAHLAGLVELIEERRHVYFEPPAARVYVISETHVAESQQAYEDGEIEWWGMTRPWEMSDVGRYYAQLLDGNHRAFAAIAAGEPYVWVYVGENYREDVAADLEGLRGLGALPQAFEVRPDGWGAAGEAAHAAFDAARTAGWLWRGMTGAEYVATIGAGQPIQSLGAYSFGFEGTNFAVHPGDAESYVNYGRDDPRRTGQPTYLVAVDAQASGALPAPDGYYKALHPVPLSAVRGIWQMSADGGRIVAMRIL